MAKNGDIRQMCSLYGVEWAEISRGLNIPMKDLVRRLNRKTISPDFRRILIAEINRIRRRPEDFYDEFR